jgi:hypothetical protein
MTATIFRSTGDEAYDLIYPEYLAMLPSMQQESMHRALKNSTQVWVGMDESRVLAVWGLIPPTLMSDSAYLWLFTTKHLHQHSLILIRHSQRLVQSMLEDYPIIHGHGHVGARRSLRWLRWLGAEFGEPQGEFLPFIIKATQRWQQDSAQSA